MLHMTLIDVTQHQYWLGFLLFRYLTMILVAWFISKVLYVIDTSPEEGQLSCSLFRISCDISVLRPSLVDVELPITTGWPL